MAGCQGVSDNLGYKNGLFEIINPLILAMPTSLQGR